MARVASYHAYLVLPPCLEKLRGSIDHEIFAGVRIVEAEVVRSRILRHTQSDSATSRMALLEEIFWLRLRRPVRERRRNIGDEEVWPNGRMIRPPSEGSYDDVM